ncbi:hypothetical protein N2152v2_007736 [Parachlorella kessleri]
MASASQAENVERLRRLQDDLLALKARISTLVLKKAAAGSSPTPLFPITLTWEVPLPPEAERYDVDGVKGRVVLRSAAALPPAPKERLGGAVEVQVVSPSLPTALREAMAQEVHRAWLASLPDEPSSLSLDTICSTLSRDFVRLLQLRPALLEAYEGVDQQGRTVRRYAILNDAASLQVDASIPGPPPRAATSGSGGRGRAQQPAAREQARRSATRPAEAAVSHAGQPADALGGPTVRCEGPGSGPEPPSAAAGMTGQAATSLHASLARELAALQTRYGAGLRVVPTPAATKQQAHDQQPQPSPPQQATEGLAGDLQQLSLAATSGASSPPPSDTTAHESPGQQQLQQPGASAASQPPCSSPPQQHVLQLQLAVQPTDPAWDPHTTLLLDCIVGPSYPAAGGLAVTLLPQPPLPALQHQVLQRLVAGELQQVVGAVEGGGGGSSSRLPEPSRGAAGPLSRAVRFVENHAGRLVRDAEDMAVEVAQRRRAAQQAQQGRTGGALQPRQRRSQPRSLAQSTERMGGAAACALAAGAHHAHRANFSGTATPAAAEPAALPSGDVLDAAACPGSPGSGSVQAAAGEQSTRGEHSSSERELDEHQASSGRRSRGSSREWSSAERPGSGYSPRAGEDPEEGEGYDCSSSSQEGEGHSGSDSDSVGEQQPHEVLTGGLGHRDGALRGGLELQLEGLSLVDCDSLEILKLSLQVGCSRCRHSADFTFATEAVAAPPAPAPSPRSPGGPLAKAWHSLAPPAAAAAAAAAPSSVVVAGLEWAGECGNCHNPWVVQLLPKLVHERSNVLAVVRAEGCVPRDLLPSMLAGQCARCAAAAAFRSVQVGSMNERPCSRCHSKLAFQFASAAFVAAAGVGEAADRRGRQGVGSASGPRTGREGLSASNVVLTVGQPLPDLGTCRHYRHSHRWLRFPCCGRRFPCDLCHEEGTDGHDMRWATRMVCGYCSTEQPLGERCKHCDKRLASTAAAPAGRNSRFWEGGAGCRDPRRMNRNDPRKHRGSKAKTQSRKAMRVGETAAGRRDARAARGEQ